MPKIVGRATRVVDVDGLSIDEYAGNVGSHDDTMSLAVVKVSKPCSEPWLTLDYDEWIAVLKGRVDLHYFVDGGSGGSEAAEGVVTAFAGDTVFVARGERFRPVFPEGGTEYVPVCIPAFKPEPCLREEEGGVNTSNVAAKLKDMHHRGGGGPNDDAATTTTTTMTSQDACHGPPNDDGGDTLYHMCERSAWDDAVASGKAYFPPTFAADGDFTHATAVPERLLDTANHFYTSSKEDWICLRLSASVLRDTCGIVTKFEGPRPVGAKDVSEDWKESQWACPHIFGGIPVAVNGVVTGTFPMERDTTNGRFLAIVGLTTTDS